MRRKSEDIKQIVMIVIVVAVIGAVIFFAAKKAVYCLQTTGQLNCTVVAIPQK